MAVIIGFIKLTAISTVLLFSPLLRAVCFYFSSLFAALKNRADRRVLRKKEGGKNACYAATNEYDNARVDHFSECDRITRINGGEEIPQGGGGGGGARERRT